MNTEILNIDSENPDMELIKKAAKIIKSGGLVAFPTETVYGLGANGLDAEASKKIYSAKGRPSDNPLILHISKREELDAIVTNIPEAAEKLMKEYWPGPLTMIFNKSAIVPCETTGGLDTVAVRMPSHKVANALIAEAGVPIAAPSANTSGRPSPTKASHVIEDMSGRIDMIIDSGMVDIGLESTIIDVTTKIPMILRPGYITAKMAEKVVGSVVYDKVVLATKKEDIGDSKPKAPGMKYRHYAPKADFTMYDGESADVVAKINGLVDKNISKGLKIGVAATDETIGLYDNRARVVSLGSRADDDSIARNLYDVLREFDEMDVDIIYGETFSRDGLGQAIMNRLTKAAGYNIVKL